MNNKSLKQFVERFFKYKYLFITLVLLSFLCFTINFYLPVGWKDLFVNLSATFLGLIFTIFIVDEIIQKERDIEYKETHTNAKEEFVILGNMVITYLREPFGFRFPSEKLTGATEDIDKLGNRINRSLIPLIKAGIHGRLIMASISDWKRLVGNMVLLRQQFAQIIPLYKDSAPPKILGRLLTLKRAYFNLELMFSLFPDLFLNDPSNWPKNKGGHDVNVSIRDDYISYIEKEIKNCLDKCELLFKELEQWKTD